MVCAIFLAAASAGARSESPSLVRIGILQQPNTLNPLVMAQFYENYISEALFSSLTVIDDEGKPQPDLAREVPSARNGGISPDGKTIVYHLRKGIRWQDGVPLTADDVAFTFAKMRDPAVPYVSLSTYADVESVTARDPLTVVVRLKKPSADILSEIFVNGQFASIVPKHLLAHAGDMRQSSFSDRPIGSGPYRLERWDHGARLILRAYRGYFRGAPALHEIQIRFFGDSNSQALALRTGELDVVPGLSPRTLPMVTGIARLKLLDVPTTTLSYIDFNNRTAPFNDVRVRKAFFASIDRGRIIRDSDRGKGIVATDILPPSSPYASRAFPSAGDLAGARRLLDAAGWQPGAGGIRMRNGRRLEIALTLASESATARTTAAMLQSMWRRIGADVTLRPQPINMQLGANGSLARSDFQAAISAFGFAVTPDRSELLSSTSFAPHGTNYARYRNTEVDRLIDDAKVTSDGPARARIFRRISSLLAGDMPIAPISWRVSTYAVTSTLENFKPETVNSDLWNVYAWKIK